MQHPDCSMMRYLMGNTAKVHTNPSPSQSSIPKVSFPVPETPMPKSRLVKHATFGIIRARKKLVINQQTTYYTAKRKVLTGWLRAPLFTVHTQVNQVELTASLWGCFFNSWRQYLGWAHYIDRSAHPYRIIWLTMATSTHSSNTTWYVAVFFNSSFRLVRLIVACLIIKYQLQD